MMKRKHSFLISSLFALMLATAICSGNAFVQHNQMRAEDEQEQNEQIGVALTPYEQLNEVYDLGIELPDPIPSIGLYALNGSKIQSPVVIMNPVVFIEFQDDTGSWIDHTSLQRMQDLYNDSPTSVKEYYKKISYGNVTIESVFFPQDNAGNVIPFKSKYNRGYIEPKSASNPIGYDPSLGDDISNENSARYHETKVIEELLSTNDGTYPELTQQMAIYAVNHGMSMNLQYTKNNTFDWDFPLSNTIKAWEQSSTDSFTFVFRGATSSVSENMILWPHKFVYPNKIDENATHNLAIAGADFSSGSPTHIFLNDYVIVPAEQETGTFSKMNMFASPSNYGVVVHEMFHQFQAPDLYRTSYKGQAVGEWDLMGAQNSIPQYLLQYTNAKFGIWDTPDFKEITKNVTLENRTDLTVNLAKYESIATDQDVAIKIVPEDTTRNEYFMVEYRKKESSGFESELPGSGLIVYRIHEGIPSTNKNNDYCGITCGNMLTGLTGESNADEVFLFRPNAPNATLFDQSAYDTENIANAAFPRTINGQKINQIGKSLTEVSVSAGFDNETLYFSDGTNSGVRIVDISDPETDTMTFTVLYGDETLENNSAITSFQAEHDTIIARKNSEISTNELSVTGGSAPYSFTIEEVKKGEQIWSDHTFAFDDHDASDHKTILTTPALDTATYTIKIKVTDANHDTKVLTLVYTIKPALPEASAITFTGNQTTASQTEQGKIVGLIGLTGCSEQGCETDYSYEYATYGLEFQTGKDYASYFQIHPLIGSGSGQVSTKGSVPAGSYECIGVVTFHDGEESVTVKHTITIAIASDVQVAKPTIDTPTGTILSSTTWMKDVQSVEVTIADDTALKAISITTQDGAFYVDGAKLTAFTKSYQAEDRVKNDTVSIPVYRNGTYTITVENTNGDTETKTFQIEKLDNEIPSLSIAFQNNTAILQASDGTPELSGIKQNSLKYTFVNDGDPTTDLTYDQTYTQPVAIPSGFSGSLCAQVYDQAGNHKELCSNTSNASDISAPILNSSDITYTPSNWTNQPVIMSFPIQDDISGIARVSVSTSDGKLIVDNQKVTSHEFTYDLGVLTQSCSFTLAQNGTYVISYMDHNANASQTSITMKYIDTLPPAFDEAGFVITQNQSDDTAELQLSAHDLPETLDEQSGVKQVYYQYVAQGDQIDETNWRQYPDADSAAWPNASNDKGSFCAYIEDEAGNTSTPQCRKLNASDTVNPVIEEIQGLVDIDTDASGWTKQVPISMSVTVSDTNGQSTGSGLKSVSIYQNNTLLQPTSHYTGQAFDTITFSVSENGSYRIEAEDQEGNTTTKPFVVNQIDTTPPVIEKIEITQQKTLLLFPTEDVNVSVIAHDLPTDRHSGITKYTYHVGTLADEEDDTAWDTINEGEHISIKKEDIGTLYVYAYDQAGNKSALYKEDITRDTKQEAPSLKSLRADHATLTPAFAPDTFTYKATVEHSVSTITFSAEAQYDGHTIGGDVGKALTLQDGEQVFTIGVSDGNDTQTYTITITRNAETKTESSADLKSLVPSTGTLNPSFTANVLTYTMSVPSDVEQLKFTAEAISDTAVITGDVDQMISLKSGSNKAVIHVQDGKTSTGYEKEKDYEITIVRLSQSQNQDATLKSLAISSGTLSPSFKASITSYRAEVDANVDSIKITAQANSSKAVISGDANKNVSLKTGDNTFQILVQAEDGTKSTYTIVITRKTQANNGKDSVDGSSKDPSTTSTILKDDQTGISIIGEFDESFAIVSEVQNDIALDEQWNQSYELKEVFDIYITKDGKRYMINDSVTVRIPRKSEWNELEGLGVVYISDQGEITGMPTTITEEYLEFTTNHFSTYAVVAKKANAVTNGVATGDTTTMMLWGTILIGILFACIIGIRRHKQLYDYS